MNHTNANLQAALAYLSLVPFPAAACGVVLFHSVWMKVFCGILVLFSAAYPMYVVIQNVRHKNKTKICIGRIDISPEEIDRLDGISFEYLLSSLFYLLGYKVKVTRQSKDYGADLVIQKEGVKTAVQAKRYNGKVSLKAVQEAVASKMYYHAKKAMVVTNSYFTKPAITLANVNEVTLIDRDELLKLIEETKCRGN